MLAMFGFMLMILVMAVSLVITWNSEDDEISFVELPMFQPLMWIAVGIFTAASMELFTRSSRGIDQDIPVLEEKAVFPHDASDFELIRQHNARHANDADEEKESVPGDIAAVIKRADELFEQGQHAQTREYLKAELPKYPPSVEMLWRLARACNYLVEEKSNPDEKKALAFEGLADAEKAYALDKDSAASNKWMAIMTSTVGNFRDLKEKIAGAYVIRVNYCYLHPRFGPSELFFSTYLKMKRTKEAANWVLKAKAVPVKTREDEEVEREIAALMKQLKLQ
ncbi:hypothetical protein AM588_10010587 [Phytophthora nicotianae]|uniref:Regulator of microtubule dynamics protein 1 n=1 Tax=Phytophthora nicotianae TaxID=4792 RepID=A0A0W8DI92_PHYNI|nr:hypothetical protein AM588_10010587 [Phytophthora nicotianae]